MHDIAVPDAFFDKCSMMSLLSDRCEGTDHRSQMPKNSKLAPRCVDSTRRSTQKLLGGINNSVYVAEIISTERRKVNLREGTPVPHALRNSHASFRVFASLQLVWSMNPEED